MSAPLSNGSVFDIEDFGLTLSHGISCPKHMWSFDLVTGQGDRGNYRLKRWQVDLRAAPETQSGPETPSMNTDGVAGLGDQEVWIRRPPRIG
jgi:hypothetical protein